MIGLIGRRYHRVERETESSVSRDDNVVVNHNVDSRASIRNLPRKEHIIGARLCIALRMIVYQNHRGRRELYSNAYDFPWIGMDTIDRAFPKQPVVQKIIA